MTNHDFTFYSKSEYYADLCARIKKAKAGDRVALASMGFDPDLPEVQQTMNALGAAAERGVTSTLLVDAYIFLTDDKKNFGPLFFHRTLPRHLSGVFQIRQEYIAKLRAQGVRVAVTNQPRRAYSSPVSGRSHIKFAVIKDRVYLGGCNLTTVDHLDMMVCWDDHKTADWLHDFAERMWRAEGSSFMRGHDITFPAGNDTEIFVDAGKPRQSIILQKALKLIDQAEKEILITCQYFPNSITTKRLLAAHRRGVKVTIIFNHPSTFPKPMNLLHHMVVARERMRMPAAFFAQQLPKDRGFLHAKIIATDKGAIIGSHNYVTAGVNFGTAEIALLRHDPAFATNLMRALQLQVTRS